MRLCDFEVGPERPFFLIAGPCVVEAEGLAVETAGVLKEITGRLGIPFLYKSSYDKANRTSLASFRGLGIEEGLKVLENVKRQIGVPVLTDVHEDSPLAEVAAVVDVLQTPAFLCRQTGFIQAVARQGLPVNIKKGQFLAPWDMRHVVDKARATGNDHVLVCERGTSFGYNYLISDMRALAILRETGCPVVFDATHSVQLPGGRGASSGGQREFVPILARAAMAVGIAGIFMETHPRPDEALSDGPNAWPLSEMEGLLETLKAIDLAVKAHSDPPGRLRGTLGCAGTNDWTTRCREGASDGPRLVTGMVRISAGQVLTGSLFNEPMRVETVQGNGPESWVVGLVGTQSERFRKVTLTAEDIGRLTIIDARYSFDGDGRLLRLALQAYALGIAYEFDPYFGHAMRHSLENRARRLAEGLKRAQELARQAPPDLPDPEEIEEMEESERERLEALLEAITLAGSAEQVREEVEELRRLAAQAQTVEDAGTEGKLSKLKGLLQKEGFFDHPDQRLLLFSEFRDTLDYLVERLKSWGFRVGCIHGGMKSGSRDEPGTRLHAEQQFREGEIQVLVATEAAGEGINLQVCNIFFNYDIPWNPNRLEQRMGRIHRYGQRKDCLIFNFVATNTIEGRVLQRLLEKLQEIRDALDDDAVFNVVGEVLPAAHVERVLRDYYAGRLGDADLEERLLRDVDERQFRAICQNALEGLASKKLNLEMLIERRARAQERRVVPETIARFLREAAEFVPLSLKTIPSLPHTFEPARTPPVLRRYEKGPDWKLPALADRYPRCSTDREAAETEKLEWVTPGHPLFEAIRRHTHAKALEVLGKGASFHSLQHEHPARMDFYRARVVDGLGQVIHEHLFAVEMGEGGEPSLREPGLLGDFAPADPPAELPVVATLPEPTAWLHEHALAPFLDETRADRLAEVERVAAHVELSLTELLQRADEEIGRAAAEVELKIAGAEGRIAQAETRHSGLLARRERRRIDFERQRALTLQAVERLASVLVLPHPAREAPEVRRLKPNLETEAVAMRVVMEHERAQGRQVYDVSEKNLGYDVTSLDLASGELRLIEVKGLGAASGTILITPNERRVAEDRRDCYWLYVVTDCDTTPQLQEPIRDPARLDWHEVTKVAHYYLSVDAMRQPMQVREDSPPYSAKTVLKNYEP